MQEYLRIADEYFRRFEGRHLYPGLGSWHWYAWIIALGGFLFTTGRALTTVHTGSLSWLALPLITELAVFVIMMAIDSHKTKKLKESLGVTANGFAAIDDRRREVLESLCGVDSSQFARLAKECKDLQELERTYRPASNIELRQIAASIYNKDARPRLLAITLAGIALFATLLTKSVPELPPLFELLNDDDVWRFVGKLVGIAVGLFVVALGLWIIALQVTDSMGRWAAKLGGKTYRSRSALPYLLRDLVRFHRPVRPAEETETLGDDRAAANESSADDPGDSVPRAKDS